VFVESAGAALRVLRGNLAALGLTGQATVVAGDAFGASSAATGPFELVLADPPYDAGLEVRLVEELGRRLSVGGVLALQHSAARDVPEAPEGLAIWKARRYGGTSLTLYVRGAEGDS
jgi:16S rRNA G966 N2-methylase RsmD